MKSPAFQYYPDKWQTDTRRLSWKAKGIYHELMCVVWIQFQDTCSIPNDDDFISGEIGCNLADWQECKAELLNPHRPILKVTETNRLFISGLHKEAVKQEDRREKLRQNGLLGGRPKNQKVILEKPKHKPGSGNQNESLPSPSPSPSPKEGESNASLPLVTIQTVFDEWNTTASRSGLPKCLLISDKRRQALNVRLKNEFFLANWRTALKRISGLKFCLGENERGWVASLDWFITPDAVVKIMEGKYKDKPVAQQNGL